MRSQQWRKQLTFTPQERARAMTHLRQEQDERRQQAATAIEIYAKAREEATTDTERSAYDRIIDALRTEIVT